MSALSINRVERRRHPREVIGGDYTLQIDTGNGRPMNCFISDISEGGARLTLTEKTTMPERLTAQIGNITRPLRLVWQKNDQIGIEFLATDEAVCSDDPLAA
jgi:PilZ domain